MDYTVGDVLVARFEITGEQRFGIVRAVDLHGTALVQLQHYSYISFYKNGHSRLGNFTVIKKEENKWGTRLVEKLLTTPANTSVISKRDAERDGSWLKEQARKDSQLESEKP